MNREKNDLESRGRAWKVQHSKSSRKGQAGMEGRKASDTDNEKTYKLPKF